MKERITELLENAVENIFLEMQSAMGIDSGDVEPMQMVNLEQAQGKLAEVIAEILTAQENATMENLMEEPETPETEEPELVEATNIDFIGIDGNGGQTQFDTHDEKELAELWWEFCKENDIICTYKGMADYSTGIMVMKRELPETEER